MSGEGAAAAAAAAEPFDASGLRVAVVAASWHTQVMDGLLAGATRACTDHKVEPDVVRVPGTFELPVVASALAQQGYDAVVALGVVIRGGTPHFDYICTEASRGLHDASSEYDIPIGFGLLTCDTMEQAEARAGGEHGNKGWDAAIAALEMSDLFERLDGADES